MPKNMQSQKMGMGRRTQIIREYRQIGGDWDRDGDTIVGIGRCWWGWGVDGYKIIYRVILYCQSKQVRYASTGCRYAYNVR